jgi:hypothetical protein
MTVVFKSQKRYPITADDATYEFTGLKKIYIKYLIER